MRTTGRIRGRKRVFRLKEKTYCKGQLSQTCLTGTNKIKVRGISLVMTQTVCLHSTVRSKLNFLMKSAYCPFSWKSLASQRSILTVRGISESYFVLSNVFCLITCSFRKVQPGRGSHLYLQHSLLKQEDQDFLGHFVKNKRELFPQCKASLLSNDHRPRTDQNRSCNSRNLQNHETNKTVNQHNNEVT